MPPPAITADCDMRPECLRLFDELKTKQAALEERQRVQGESLAALRAQVAFAGALGAIIGSGASTLLSRLLGH